MYIHWTIFQFFFASFSVCPACGSEGFDDQAVFVILPQVPWHEITFGKRRCKCNLTTRGGLSLINMELKKELLYIDHSNQIWTKVNFFEILTF